MTNRPDHATPIVLNLKPLPTWTPSAGTTTSLQAKTTCPDCDRLWWRDLPREGQSFIHDSRPAPCRACQAARDFAALSWWRRLAARIHRTIRQGA